MICEYMWVLIDVMYDVDVIVVLVDVTDRRRNQVIYEMILIFLENYVDLLLILILNKIDNVKIKLVLLDIVCILMQDREKDDWGYKNIGGWSKFEYVFMIFVKIGDGVEEIKQYFVVKSKFSEWLFFVDICIDQNFE